MRSTLPALAVIASLALPGAAQAVKMMYACTGGTGRTSIQDQPCSGETTQQQSYATPDAGSAPHRSPALPRKVDFSVACRSLDEDRADVIEHIRASAEDPLTRRLQKQLQRIHQAQCTAHCGAC